MRGRGEGEGGSPDATAALATAGSRLSPFPGAMAAALRGQRRLSPPAHFTNASQKDPGWKWGFLVSPICAAAAATAAFPSPSKDTPSPSPPLTDARGGFASPRLAAPGLHKRPLQQMTSQVACSRAILRTNISARFESMSHPWSGGVNPLSSCCCRRTQVGSGVSWFPLSAQQQQQQQHFRSQARIPPPLPPPHPRSSSR